MTELLQVRQAARMLGVHENTLRRWEEKGLLAARTAPQRRPALRCSGGRGRARRDVSGHACPAADEADDVVAVHATPIDE